MYTRIFNEKNIYKNVMKATTMAMRRVCEREERQKKKKLSSYSSSSLSQVSVKGKAASVTPEVFFIFVVLFFAAF
jgi:hypothetical protein